MHCTQAASYTDPQNSAKSRLDPQTMENWNFIWEVSSSFVCIIEIKDKTPKLAKISFIPFDSFDKWSLAHIAFEKDFLAHKPFDCPVIFYANKF